MSARAKSRKPGSRELAGRIAALDALAEHHAAAFKARGLGDSAVAAAEARREASRLRVTLTLGRMP